jgi:NADPH:quinone reductase-like Zn-dependent oxidoreductase
MTRAILLDDYGSPDVLRLGEVEVDSPGPGHIRVTVRYAGVGPTDLAIRAGRLRAVFPAGPGAVLGFEAAGVVEGVADALDTVMTRLAAVS